MSRKKAEAVAGTGSDWGGYIERRAPRIALALVVLATLRIVTTYPVFNHTIDEPGHIASGIEWLDKGSYVLDPHHPPLSRLMMAIGPYLDGARAAGRADVHREGVAILYGADGSAYDRRLTLARLGILPFFWLACGVVYLGCVRWLDRATAAIAVFLLTFQPAILAHSGLATTDMALTATLGAALYAFLRLVEEPTVARGVVLGLWSGFAILSKFTAIPFFAVCVTAVGVIHAIRTRPALGKAARGAQRLAIPVAAGLAVVAVVTWAGYRFAMGPNSFTGITMPAPQFFDGIAQIMDHVDKGHPSYLLGMTSQKGFWYYYPVALAVKLPLPLARVDNHWRGDVLEESGSQILDTGLARGRVTRVFVVEHGQHRHSSRDAAPIAVQRDRRRSGDGVTSGAAAMDAEDRSWVSRLARGNFGSESSGLSRLLQCDSGRRTGEDTRGFGPRLGPGHETAGGAVAAVQRKAGLLQPADSGASGGGARLSTNLANKPGATGAGVDRGQSDRLEGDAIVAIPARARHRPVAEPD